MRFPSKETVARLREMYPKGTRVELVSMDDPYTRLKPGDKGRVDFVDDGGTARTMLSNSEFTLLLNQSANDRLEIAKLLGISENQLSYVTNAESGSGLLKCAGAIVPVQDRYPHNSTYRLMTTKPSEVEVWQA